jgi:hypothetical protein
MFFISLFLQLDFSHRKHYHVFPYPLIRIFPVVRFWLAGPVFEAYYSCQVCAVEMQDAGVPFWLAPPQDAPSRFGRREGRCRT